MSSISSEFVSVGRSLTEETAESLFRGQVLLVQIELRAYGANAARTLYLSTRSFVDKTGQPWVEAISEPPSIDYGGEFLATGWQPAAADFEVLDRWLPFQDVGETFSDLLAAYEFTAARVWIRQAFLELNDASDYPTLFDGEIAEWDDATNERVPFHAVTFRSWTVKFPDRKLTEADFPAAPIEARGTPLSWVFGDWRARRYLENPNTPGTIEATDAGIARGALPVLIVDAPTGTGLELPRFLVSDRDIDGATSTDSRLFLFEQGLGRLAGPLAATLANPAGGPATLELTSTQAKVFVLPIEVDSASVGITDSAAEALREDKGPDLAGKCSLDFDAGKLNGRWLMPDVSPAGSFVSADLLVFYAKNAWAGTAGEAFAYRLDSFASTVQAFGSGASITFPAVGFEQVTTIPLATNVCGSWGDLKNIAIECNVKAAGQKLDVYRIGIRVTFRPAAKLERPGVQRSGTRTGEKFNARGQRVRGDGNGAKVIERVASTSSPDVLSFDHPAFWYGRGKLDTAGTITGTAGALIEHPVDVARYILEEMGVPLGEIETTPGQFGAFPDARTALAGYKFCAAFSRQQNLDAVLERIGSESLCWFRRKATAPGAPFVAIPWDVGMAADFRSASDVFTFSRLSPYVREKSLTRFRTKVSDVVNRLTVNFDWDARTNTYAQQLWIREDGSRVYTGGAYTTDATREAAAAESIDDRRYGTREHTVDLQFVVDPATATDYLCRLFDLLVFPRVGIRFDTWANAYGLECGHRIELGATWDDVAAFPRPGSGGSWASKVFTVTGLRRTKDRPAVYEIEAVETTS